MPVSFSLNGKVALITGGSRGIGAAAVRLFVHAGAYVFFSYEKAKMAADALVRECGESNLRRNVLQFKWDSFRAGTRLCLC